MDYIVLTVDELMAVLNAEYDADAEWMAGVYAHSTEHLYALKALELTRMKGRTYHE